MEANVPFETDIVWGLDPQLVSFYDEGLPRSAAQIVQHGKHRGNAAAVSAAARIEFLHRDAMMNEEYAWSTKTYSNHAVAELVEKDGPMFSAAERALLNRLDPKNLVLPSVAIWTAYKLLQINSAKAEEFCYTLAKGYGLQQGDPIGALRRAFLNGLASKKKRDTFEQAALIFRTWNHWMAGTRRNVLSFKEGDAFPLPMEPK